MDALALFPIPVTAVAVQPEIAGQLDILDALADVAPVAEPAVMPVPAGVLWAAEELRGQTVLGA